MAIVVALVAVPAVAFGHATVWPKSSTAGAHERYVLRVPNEKGVATTRVEIRFAADMRVTAFSDVPGWQLEVLVDSAKRIVGAVWTGSLAPQRFVELPFVAANPKPAAQVTWPVYQTYADGERVEWTGAAGSKSPASVTSIALAAAATPAPGISTAWVPWAALGVSLVALGFAIRPRA